MSFLLLCKLSLQGQGWEQKERLAYLNKQSVVGAVVGAVIHLMYQDGFN